LSRRGIQWNKSLEAHRNVLIVNHKAPGYALGLPSAEGDFFSYLCPPTKYLSVKPEDRYRNAFDLPWDQPKVIMNANRKGSVHPWRIAAFPDRNRLVAYHTYGALWPAEGWSVEILSAVLNGPLANAYVTAHETGAAITNEVLDAVPVPHVTPGFRERVESLVREYVGLVGNDPRPPRGGRTAERVLLEIDAAVLQGYDLPPRLERKLLDYFNGQGEQRPVRHSFADYFPSDYRPCFPLTDYLSAEFRRSSAKELKNLRESMPERELELLRAAFESIKGGEDD
jgi:hypothetical protein